jgi:hypothetical protein
LTFVLAGQIKQVAEHWERFWTRRVRKTMGIGFFLCVSPPYDGKEEEEGKKSEQLFETERQHGVLRAIQLIICDPDVFIPPTHSAIHMSIETNVS